MPPKVSVIINTFNRPYMLKQAVASVLAQTLDDWQVVIAVDHKYDSESADYSATFNAVFECECFGERFKTDDRIRCVFTDIDPQDKSVNRFARGINLAFKESTGEYVSYLCDDDLYLPWRLSMFAKALDANPDWYIVYGRQIIWDIPTDTAILERPASQILPQHPEGLSTVDRVNHNSIMHRRECFDAVGGWVENAPARLGDAYFFARLNRRWAFHPVDCVGDIQRKGEQCCWSFKPISEAEKKDVGAWA